LQRSESGRLLACPLAGDAQAKLALIIAQIYLTGERMDSVHLSVCSRQLESMGDFYSSKLQRGEY